VSRPRRRAAGRPVVLAAVALVLTGCVQPGALESELVACKEGDDGEPANGVVLMAQAVPTASFVPCLRGMPLGWHFSDLEVRNEEARFWLDSDRDGFHAIEVRLTAECDTRDATEINTDRDAMRRFELVREVSPRFIADRFYVGRVHPLRGRPGRAARGGHGGHRHGGARRPARARPRRERRPAGARPGRRGGGRPVTAVGDPSAPVRPSKPAWRRLLGPLLSVALVVAVFVVFLPQFTSLSDVWTSVRSMSWLEVVVLLLAAAWNLATYQFVMTSTMPGLTLPQAFVSTQTTTAVSNTVVGGAAISLGLTYAMNSSWGFSRSRTSVSLLVSGLWNNFAKLGLPVVALTWLAFSDSPTAGRVVGGLLGIAALVVCLVLLGMLLRSREAAARIGTGTARVASALLRPFGRGPVTGWDHAVTKFRDRTALLLRARWLAITLATVVSHLSLFAVLLLALRFVGVGADEVSAAEALAVFAFARLLTAIPFTPGGLGVIELALITGLAAAGGARALVAAAVLIFRALTYVLPIPLGLATYVFWRRNHSWRRAPNTAPRTELVPETV
jgi:uncharacterized membrane protein YbhN (UPF0104 family)